ncbi:MAG TPA: hypothetical protein PLB25_19330 [Rhodoferax sp.]|nr:hypothetical protein [Rhodoferax sp.]
MSVEKGEKSTKVSSHFNAPLQVKKIEKTTPDVTSNAHLAINKRANRHHAAKFYKPSDDWATEWGEFVTGCQLAAEMLKTTRQAAQNSHCYKFEYA